MVEVEHGHISTNGISMHVAEAGDGPLVVCVHGFPELWYSWRHQIPVLAQAGYHVVVPDMRGYGGTDRPDDIEAYDIVHLTDDLLGLLDALGPERAVFVGHDWGAAVVWQLALRAPERVQAVANLSVPYRPSPARPPTEILRERFSDIFFYQLYFQRPGPADTELASDVRTTLRRILWSWSGDGFPDAIRILPKEGTRLLDTVTDPPSLPPWLTEDDLDTYVEAFEQTGFTGGLNWYRNHDRNWELQKTWGDVVTPPTLFVGGENDGVLRFLPADRMPEWVTDLRRMVIVPGAGHWIQQERPDVVNEELLAFLKEVT